MRNLSLFSLFQALGCILFFLCFMEHPFEDSAKLRILNGKYTIPENDTKYTVFHDLISKYKAKMDFCQCICKGNLRYIRKCQNCKLILLNLTDFEIDRYSGIGLDIVHVLLYTLRVNVKYSKLVCKLLLFFLQETNHFLEVLFN